MRAGEERHSAVFFFYPQYDAKIPLPGGGGGVSLLQNQSREAEAGVESGKFDEGIKDMPFGAYIAQKWKQVSRAS